MNSTLTKRLATGVQLLACVALAGACGEDSAEKDSASVQTREAPVRERPDRDDQVDTGATGPGGGGQCLPCAQLFGFLTGTFDVGTGGGEPPGGGAPPGGADCSGGGDLQVSVCDADVGTAFLSCRDTSCAASCPLTIPGCPAPEPTELSCADCLAESCAAESTNCQSDS